MVEEVMNVFLQSAKKDCLLLDEVKWFFGLPEDMIKETLQKVAQDKIEGLRFSESFEEKIFALYDDVVPKALELYIKYYLNGFNREEKPWSIKNMGAKSQVKMLNLLDAKDLLELYQEHHELCIDAQEVLLTKPDLFEVYVSLRKVAATVLLEMFQSEQKEKLTMSYIKFHRLDKDSEIDMIRFFPTNSDVIMNYIKCYGFRENTGDMLMVKLLESFSRMSKTVEHLRSRLIVMR